ncbi:hypothetical protein SteCoe_32230 [Stentor coeruleus]|uniref:Uncharacterized protein n=1 Tax=Stentor coeruleus TaxID=5963 RepID=A0A1R2AZH7_9CILI|nr:hypothetical protein SteCoe_32230 [Stentor coeruleus]
MEKTIFAFKNFFTVKIDLIHPHDEVKSFVPLNIPPKTKIPILFLVKFDRYYGMGFTKLMTKIEDEKYNKDLQTRFLNYMYFYKAVKQVQKPEEKPEEIKIEYPPCVPLSGSLTSQRTHISQLPLNEQIIQELECNYLHCYAITERYNQVSAMAFALKLAIEAGSNAEFTKIFAQNFQSGKSMCNLTFNNPFYFNYSTHEQIIEYMKNIYQAALIRPRDLGPEFDYIVEGTEFIIENAYSRDFSFIEVLSKVFGVTSLIIICENDYRVISYNGSTSNFRPVLHFLALKETYDTYRMYVLLTREYCFENKYDFKTGYSEKCNGILKKTLCEYKINLEPQKEDKSKQNYKFLIEASNIQNKILSDVMDSVKSNKPITIDKTYVQAKCMTLKTLSSAADVQFLVQNGMSNLRIMNESLEDLNQTCHYCNKPIEENDFKGASCFYHNTCIAIIYINYYRNNRNSERKKIDQIALICPVCQSRIMNLSEFLEKSYGAEYQIDAKEYYNNEILCSHCKNFIDIDRFVNVSHQNDNCPEKYCFECSIEKLYDKCRVCTCGGQINLDPTQIPFVCSNCKKEKKFEDLIQLKIDNGFACKKCWIICILNGSYNQLLNQQDQNSLCLTFQNECIACVLCGRLNLRHYNKEICCPTFHTEEFCYECFYNSNNVCRICESPFISLI